MLADSNPFEECKSKEEAIQLYLKRLNEIKEFAQHEYGIETNEFTEMFENEFLTKRTTPIPIIAHSERICKYDEISQFSMHIFKNYSIKHVYNLLRRYMFYIIVFGILFILVNNRVELSKIFMRNIQVYIYPCMRFWRKLTLPIIRQFPELTRFYDETCLVSNPFFRVANMDCSPCADVINVVDLSITPELGYLSSNIPHIIQQVR